MKWIDSFTLNNVHLRDKSINNNNNNNNTTTTTNNNNTNNNNTNSNNKLNLVVQWQTIKTIKTFKGKGVIVAIFSSAYAVSTITIDGYSKYLWL